MSGHNTEFIRKRPIALLIIFLLVSQSCIKDFPGTIPTQYIWKPLIAFPIGEADFGLVIPYGFDESLLDTVLYQGILTPYWRTLKMIPMSGGVDFNFEEVLGQREEISLVTLRLNAYNGFSTDIKVQAYLEDVHGNILDSLFEDKFIMKRGELDGGGYTKSPGYSMEEVVFDSLRLDVLFLASKINFVGELISVPFFDKYLFTVQLAAKLQIKSDI